MQFNGLCFLQVEKEFKRHQLYCLSNLLKLHSSLFIYKFIVMSDSAQLVINQVDGNAPQKKEAMDSRIFFNLLEKAGAFGQYQKAITFIWCIVGYLCGGLLLIIPFLYYQDPYVCPDKFPGVNCQEYVCSFSPSERVYFIPEKSMQTLANKFGDFRCPQEKLQIDSLITLTYVGTVVGFLLLSFVGDLLGRKRLMIICMTGVVIGLAITIFCESLVTAGIGLFIASVGVQNAFNICFYFISQTVSEDFREKASVAIQLFYGLGVLLNVLWYFWIKDWQMIFVLFYFLPAVASTIGIVIIVRDTPICLVMRNSPSKALQQFEYIARMNKKKDFHMSQLQLINIKQNYGKGEDSGKQKRFSILDLFRFKSLRGMTLMLVLLQCTIIFQFYAPALMLDKFKMSIFINGLVIGVSEIISYPIAYLIIMKSKRQFVAYGCFAASFLCSGVLIFVWDQEDQNPDIENSIGVLALIFIFRFAVSLEYTFFYVYFNELYPTQIRVIGTSLVSVMGGVMVTIAPEVIDACISSGFPVMILFTVLSALSVVCSSKLPQTLYQVPSDVIKELRVDSTSIISNPQTDSGLGEVLLKKNKISSTQYSSEPDLD